MNKRTKKDQRLLGKLKFFLEETKSCNPNREEMEELIHEIGYNVKPIAIWRHDPDLV